MASRSTRSLGVMFNVFQARRHRREFRAAVIAYLGQATYVHLSAGEKERVDAEALRILKASFTPSTAMSFFTTYWQVKAQTRARAMKRLGIEPLGDGLSWRAYIPTLLVMPEVTLFNDFNPNADATLEAQSFLREKGVLVHSPNELHNDA